MLIYDIILTSYPTRYPSRSWIQPAPLGPLESPFQCASNGPRGAGSIQNLVQMSQDRVELTTVSAFAAGHANPLRRNAVNAREQ